MLHIGTLASLELEVPAERLVDQYACRRAPIEDLAAAVVDALELPLDFPPLRRAVVPGDRVVLALDDQLPRPEIVIGPIVELLISVGVEPDGITILLPNTDSAEQAPDPRRALPAEIRTQVQLERHVPDDRKALAYLAATKAGERIYLNRLLADADLVLPLVSSRVELGWGAFGGTRGLFPGFADLPAQARYRREQLAALAGGSNKLATEESDEVGWLLGVQLVLEVVPGPRGEAIEVLAGTAAAVARRGQQMLDHAWRHPSDSRADLVIAGIDAPPEAQTWTALGQALAVARQLVSQQGSILVCCGLGGSPSDLQLGAGMSLVVGSDRFRSLEGKLRKELPTDTISAATLQLALDEGKVFLYSKLPPAFVEELGLAPVETADQVRHLTQRHKSCLVLHSAQHLLLEG